MDRRLRRGALSVCAGLLALACGLPAGAGAADFSGAQLSLVGPAPTAALVAGGTGTGATASADVVLTVRNDSAAAGPLSISYVLADGTRIVLGRPATTVTVGTDKAQAALASQAGSPLRIGARQVARLRLRLDVTPAQEFAGTLVVAIARTRAVSPLAVPLTVALANPVTWSGAQLEPAALTINASRCWPAVLHVDCPNPGAQSVEAQGIVVTGVVPKGTVLATAVASSDSGGRATVTLRAAEAIAVGATGAKLEVKVTDVTRYGTYDTTVPLVPGDADSPRLDVKTVARDWWLWPLLVVLLGTLVAYWLLKGREQQRPRELLQLQLRETRGRYRAALEQRGNDLHMPYQLGYLFPHDDDDWTCGCANHAAPEALRLYCRVKKATTQEELDEVAGAVADLDLRVAYWPRACDASTVLLRACIALQDADRDLSKRMCDAARELIDHPAPDDACATATYITLVEQQSSAAGRWLTAHALLVQADELRESLELSFEQRGLSDDDRKLLARIAGELAAYRVELRDADSLDALQESGVADRLRRNLRRLRQLDYDPARQGIMPAALLREDAPSVPLRAEVAAAVMTLETTPAALAATPTLDAARALHRIRRRDWFDAACVFAIATLAYFVTIYQGGAFGSVWQYLIAFAAGAGGQVAANWQLVPWYRSYRPRSPTAA